MPEVLPDRFAQEQVELLNDVYQTYGQLSGFKLRDMTHSEPPWLDAPNGGEIGPAAMAEFFKTRLRQ